MPSLLRPCALPACLAALFAFVPPQQAAATSALYFTDAEQARLSTAVVVATAVSSRQEIHPRWGRPLTFTTFAVDEVLFGEAPGAVEVEQIGGERDGITSRIPGDAVFSAGERCVLFLRKVDGGWYLTSLGQSKYAIVVGPQGERLERQLSLALFTRDEQGHLKPHDEPLRDRPRSLDALRSELVALGQDEGAR